MLRRLPLLRPGSAIVLTAMLLTGTSACGFHPMYGDHASQTSPVATDLAAVTVDLVPDRTGQLLRNQLVRLLNPDSRSEPRRYTLSVELNEVLDSFAVERSGFASRANIELTAKWRLIDDATGSPVFVATSRAVAGYNLLDNDFSTVVATNDARSRAADQIAYEIRNRVAGYFSRLPAETPSGAPSPDRSAPDVS